MHVVCVCFGNTFTATHVSVACTIKYGFYLYEPWQDEIASQGLVNWA